MEERLLLEDFFLKQWAKNLAFLTGCALFVYTEWTLVDLPHTFELEENILLYANAPMPQSTIIANYIAIEPGQQMETCPTFTSNLIGYLCPQVDSSTATVVTAQLILTSTNGRLFRTLVLGDGHVRSLLDDAALSVYELCLISLFGIQLGIDLILLLLPTNRCSKAALLTISALATVYVCRGFWLSVLAPYDESDWGVLFQAFYRRCDLLALFRLLIGCLLIARIVWFMSTHPRLAFLATTISIGLSDIVQFFFILLAIYCLLACIAHVFLGDRVAGFAAGDTLWLQYQYLLAQWDFDNLNYRVPNKVVLFGYLLLFQLVFLLVIMNVFQAVLIAAFEQAATRSRASNDSSLSVVEDGVWVVVEAWKSWREAWPSRKSVLMNKFKKDEGWTKMETFYKTRFPVHTTCQEVDTQIVEQERLTAEIEACLAHVRETEFVCSPSPVLSRISSPTTIVRPKSANKESILEVTKISKIAKTSETPMIVMPDRTTSDSLVYNIGKHHRTLVNMVEDILQQQKH